jgi:hypothetical protein
MTPQDAMDRADEITAETAYRLQLAREARALGRAQAVTDAALGRQVSYDVGLGARQDARGFVHALIEGFAAGSADRQALAAQILAEPEAAG